MSCPLIAWAWHQAKERKIDPGNGKERGLSPSERLTLLAVAERTNGDDLECWPSIALLAKDAGLSERSVQMALRELAKGSNPLIRIEERFRQTSKYHLNYPQGANSAPSDQGESTAPCQGAAIAPGANDDAGRVQNLQNEGATIAPESPIESLKEESPKEERKTVVLRTTAPAEPDAAQPDIKAQLWEEGRAILYRLDGQGPRPAGATIGKLLNLANQSHTVVLDALRAAEEVRPSGELWGWLTRAVQKRMAPKPDFDPANLTGAQKVLWRIKCDREALARGEYAA
jgi:hypothetical protein